jgi:hypothetical protein
MEKFYKILLLLCFATTGYSQTPAFFEGEMKWELKAQYADPSKAEKLKADLARMNSPEVMAKIKDYERNMKDSSFHASMEANPAMKNMMDQMLLMSKAMEENKGEDPLMSMLPKGIIIKTKDSNYVVQMEGGISSTLGEILYLKKMDKKYLIKKDEKKYSEIPLALKDTTLKKSIITATDEYDKILNYKCRKYTVEYTKAGKKVTQSVWASKEFKDIYLAPFYDLKIEETRTGIDYSRIEGTPLKVVITNEQLIVTLTALEISKKPVDPSLFVLPKDFKETKANSISK